MLFYWCILFMSIGGILGDDICQERVISCSDDFPDDFPKNEEELLSGCRIFQDSLKCIKNVLEDCGEDTTFGIFNTNTAMTAVRKMELFLYESCDPDSQIYQVISEHIECAYPVLQTSYITCGLLRYSESRKNFANRTLSKIVELRGESDELNHCLISIWDRACSATLVSDKCGSEVLLPMTEVLSNVDYYYQYFCDEEMRELLIPFAKAFALAEQEVEDIENEIKKKK